MRLCSDSIKLYKSIHQLKLNMAYRIATLILGYLYNIRNNSVHCGNWDFRILCLWPISHSFYCHIILRLFPQSLGTLILFVCSRRYIYNVICLRLLRRIKNKLSTVDNLMFCVVVKADPIQRKWYVCSKIYFSYSHHSPSSEYWNSLKFLLKHHTEKFNTIINTRTFILWLIFELSNVFLTRCYNVRRHFYKFYTRVVFIATVYKLNCYIYCYCSECFDLRNFSAAY